ALFLSRRPINDKQLNELTLFSPGSQKKGNLIFLADELARYGKSVEYMRVYAFIDRIFPLNDIEKSHYQLKAAQSALSIGALTKAEQFYGKSLEQSKSLRCTSETQRSCDKLRKEQRDFLISWNNEEKTKPSRSLQNSYTTFMKYNPEDIQMGYWAAQLAHQRGDLKVAHNHYKVVSQESRKQKSPLAQKLFDQSLQSQIVIAESTGNQEIKSDTYRNYIAVKPDGKYAIESRYQLAYLDYEKKQYQKAQSQFEELSKISLSELTNSDRALIKKSADLNLDCLALLQEDKKIIFWSSHYSKIWPKNSNEFLVIKRRATLKYATKVHNDKKSDKEELQEALIAMRQLSFRNVSEKEQLILLTTQALIAEKIRDTRELQRSSKKILTYKSATASDRKFALRQLIWVAEVHLDFKSAYQLTKQLGRDNLSQSSYILRLALLADLAGVSPKNHYQEYLRRYPYGSQNYEVRARLVLMDRRPWKALNQHLRFLRNRPQILADLTFEIFAQHRDLQRLQDVAKVKGFRTTDSGRLLQRHLDYTDVFRAAQRLSKQKIISTNDRRLKQTLTARLQLINQMESEFQRASARKEWGIQTLALTYLRKEYLNLYNTITQLPIPRGLNKEERTRYQSALLAEANPYKLKSEKISEKLNKAWKDSTYLDYLSQSKSESKLSVRTLWATEAQYLSQVAPSWRKGRLNQIASRSQLNSRKISKAKNELKSDPFNADKVENLQSLVKYSGQESMSSFLSARLDQINKEKKQ
ncbi:MAG: hypothetical protein KDD61_13390, partial [Bdellovibrionales bacterium]|nr:hypothetical protein [Bdellovibrionales bacterium]